MSRILIFIFFSSIIFSTSCAKLFVSYDGKVKKKERSRVSEHHFSEGMKFFILDEMPESESWFKKAYEISPENAGVNYMLARVNVNKGDFNQALFYVNKAVKTNDKNPYYLELQAEIYRAQSNMPEALKVYKNLVETFPNKEEYYLELGAMYIYQHKLEEAIGIYNSAEKQFGKTPELSKQKQQLFIRMKDVDAALNESKELADEFPGEQSYQLAYAELLLKNDRKEEAKNVLNALLKADSENPYARYILATLYRTEGNQEKFLEEIDLVFQNPEMELETKVSLLAELKENSLKTEQKKTLARLASSLPVTHPQSALAHMAYADMLLAADEKKEAWKQYLMAKDLDNTNYALWNHLIILDSELNELDSMVVHSEKALELYPNQASLWYLNGSAYMLANRAEDAVASLEHGKRLSGSNKQMLLQFNVLLGDSYNDLEDYNKSDQAYDAALSIDSANPHVLNNYSYFLSLRNENLDKALGMAEKLMKIAPDNAAYLDTYAWILYKMNRLEDSKKYLEKAVDISQDGTIVEHYGDVLYKLGQTDKAIEEWIKARKLGQTSENINKKITDRKLYE